MLLQKKKFIDNQISYTSVRCQNFLFFKEKKRERESSGSPFFYFRKLKISFIPIGFQTLRNSHIHIFVISTQFLVPSFGFLCILSKLTVLSCIFTFISPFLSVLSFFYFIHL
ncbi:hypothetical protein PUN28_009233 [Cardiocondyla obscurior]|uniref:Transmembrane protein n=1 Tax=Cardiocondyla obscurior TaxID=286306 RepID=A0AAW2FSR5_9HYME